MWRRFLKAVREGEGQENELHPRTGYFSRFAETYGILILSHSHGKSLLTESKHRQ